MNEHEIQNLAVKALRKIGFICIVTSNRKRTANTKGTPDVFVKTNPNSWTALEFKQPGGKVSLEQATLNEEKGCYIIDSIEKAIHACMKARI